MKRPKNSSDKKSIGALSSAALLAFLLEACAGGAGNLKGTESLKSVKDVDAFIDAAAKQSDVRAMMKGMRIKLGLLEHSDENFYEFNGIQDDGTVIECAESGRADMAQSKAGAEARLVFMEAYLNPEVRVLVEDVIGGKLSRKIGSGNASGIQTPTPHAPRMANGRYVRCAHAKEADTKREKKEQKSGTRRAKGKR